MFLLVSSASADIVIPKKSPISKVSQRVGVTDISVEYSSPAVKGRKAFGEIVPFGEIWRTGADMCSKISFSTDISLAKKHIPAGSYCLFTIPQKDHWTIIINKNPEQPGAFLYSKENDVARFEVPSEKSLKTERLLFTVTDFDDNKGNINIAWDTTKVSIPFSLETKKLFDANVAKLNKESTVEELTDTAKYLLHERNDIETADNLVSISLEKKETWANNWIKAQILSKQGKEAEAKEHAKKAIELGDDSVAFNYFKIKMEELINK